MARGSMCSIGLRECGMGGGNKLMKHELKDRETPKTSILKGHQKQDAPKKSASTVKPKVISLFCGAGGLDIGFSQAGFEILMAADYDPTFVATHNENSIGSKVAVQLDLSNATSSDLLASLSSIVKKPDNSTTISGIIGGPPCQGFSQANTTRTGNDPRNNLARQYAKIIAELAINNSIDFFVLENVAGLLEKKNLNFLSSLKRILEKKFDIHSTKLNAKDFGVPQSRERFFMVGFRKSAKFSASFQFPIPTHQIPRTVRDAIGNLPEATLFEKGLRAEQIPFHPNHWTMRPRSRRFSKDLVSTGRSLVRLDWDKPSRTVAYGHREIHVHPSGLRRLSIYEAMLLQGFPADYRISGNLSQQVTQVSNAVPPPLAQAIGRSILTFLSAGKNEAQND